MWFRQDLRLADNHALAAAVHTGRPVIPIYVLDDAAAGAWAMGGASRWWLNGSLESLGRELRRRRSRLILLRGRTEEVLLGIARTTGADAIYFTRAYEPWAAALERSLNAACKRAGVALLRYPGNLLREPGSVCTGSGEPYRVFTPFYRALAAMDHTPPAPEPPATIPAPRSWPRSADLEDWDLLPTKPDWAGGLRATWSPGEDGAARRLEALLGNALAGYAEDRDRPDQPGTSMLSPHLHFGEVSPGHCWRALEAVMAANPGVADGAAAFRRELGWREFNYHLLHHFPHMVDTPLRPEFAAFEWDQDEQRAAAGFEAWRRGQTGYPIVDAGMRQLWETGWMHNRVRMVTASFLIKHLRVPWQRGDRWFWDTLVDADLANNSASWQWVAGCGVDAAPFFRIFNPVVQGQKFDPDGSYVRRFVPELAGLGARHIHAPWTAPEAELAAAGIRLGETYPHPIVDHVAARQAALAAYARIRPR